MLIAGSNPIATQKDRAEINIPPTDWAALASPLKPFLKAVNEQLREQVHAFEPEVASFAEYALTNQGKQLRPTLVGLAGQADNGFEPGLAQVAVIIEMVHLATLVHDDIMDQATIRRNRPTLCEHSGSEVSVLLGDCLFARALELASEFPTTKVCQRVARATRSVCSGEILQTLRYKKQIHNREDYLRTLRMKTAELFALSCELGGNQIGLNSKQCLALREYGFALGTAYQIYDDCLDIFGSEASAGKSLGTDLRTGKFTLPILLLLERVGESKKMEMIAKLFQWEESLTPWLMDLLAANHTLEGSVETIDQYLARAQKALFDLTDDRHGASLNGLLAFLAGQVSRLHYT